VDCIEDYAQYLRGLNQTGLANCCQLDRIDIVMAIALSCAQIHLWCAFYEKSADLSLLARYREILCPSERRQEMRFHFVNDRVRYLVTRVLVRTVLSKYASVSPQEWKFAPSSYGRPQILNRLNPEETLQFNVSHTRSLIILAVSRQRYLGVDTENTHTRRVSIGLADSYFAAAEVSALHACPVERQHERFFEYWTLKESYIKARSMGLSIPLNEFSFAFEDDRVIRLKVEASLGDFAERWHFWQFRIANDYLIAICAERRGVSPPSVTLRKIVPLVSVEPLEYEPWRASH